jgi:hypothetical protein
MEREHRAEWFSLRNEAVETLRKGFPEQPRDGRVFQLLVLPSFDASFSWEVYERRLSKNEFEAIAVKTIWHLREDSEKFRNPVVRLKSPRKLAPTISVSAARIEQTDARSMVEELSQIVLPVHPGPVPVYLDGTSYELTLESGSTGSRHMA